MYQVLRNFNRRLSSLLRLVDLSRADHESTLAKSVRAIRGLIMHSLKIKLWDSVMKASHSGDAQTLQSSRKPRVTIDRHKASMVVTRGKCDTLGRRTVFGQLYQQLHYKPPRELRNQARAFYSEFKGEYADDYGGPYREVMSQAAEELMSSALPLFIPCANAREGVGQNQDRYVPNPAAKT